MIYKGKEAVIEKFVGNREKPYFIYPEDKKGMGIYLSNSGEWGQLEHNDGWWASIEEAEAFLGAVPSTPEYDEYDQEE